MDGRISIRARSRHRLLIGFLVIRPDVHLDNRYKGLVVRLIPHGATSQVASTRLVGARSSGQPRHALHAADKSFCGRAGIPTSRFGIATLAMRGVLLGNDMSSSAIVRPTWNLVDRGRLQDLSPGSNPLLSLLDLPESGQSLKAIAQTLAAGLRLSE